MGDDYTTTCGSHDGEEEQLSWTAPFSGNFTFDTAGSYSNTTVSLLNSACSGTLACMDNDPHEALAYTLTSGQTVTISVDGPSGDRYELSIYGEQCTDSVDNDGNGDTDCDDASCTGDPACPP